MLERAGREPAPGWHPYCRTAVAYRDALNRKDLPGNQVRLGAAQYIHDILHGPGHASAGGVNYTAASGANDREPPWGRNLATQRHWSLQGRVP